MTDLPGESQKKPLRPKSAPGPAPSEQLIYDLVEEWASSTEEPVPEHREAGLNGVLGCG